MMIALKLEPIINLNQENFYQLCQENPESKLERTATGELIVMSPTGGETGRNNANINAQLWLWNERTKLGEVFDSSTGFTLPNGADRSPDASWIEKSRWQGLNPEDKAKFIPLCPDFLIELLSPNDSLKKTQEKMQEYQANGCRLGWLINTKTQEVEIYRLGKLVEKLTSPEQLLGEDVLLGFVLDLKNIFNPI